MDEEASAPLTLIALSGGRGGIFRLITEKTERLLQRKQNTEGTRGAPAAGAIDVPVGSPAAGATCGTISALAVSVNREVRHP